MELILVRHARPLAHHPAAGAADPALHAEGHDQACRLGRWLAAEGVDAVYSSPARRARETAGPTARLLGLEPVVVDGLSEFEHGAASYVPIEDLQAANDERWLALARGELYGCVDPAAFRHRVVETVERIIGDHPGRVVAAFCHGGVVNAYFGHLLGIATPLWFAPRYTGVSRVAASRGGARSVVSLNETGHLHQPRP